MRRIQVKIRYFKAASPNKSACWQDNLKEGIFLAWGQDSDGENHTYPVAIIELADGSVITATVENIRFLS